MTRALLLLSLVATTLKASDDPGSVLSPELIQRAVDVAAKWYLGDPDQGFCRGDREYFYGSFSSELRDQYLSVFESVPATRDLLRLALPRPPRSQMLLLRPPSIELSSKP